MKKIALVLTVGIMLGSLAGCGDSSKNTPANTAVEPDGSTPAGKMHSDRPDGQ